MSFFGGGSSPAAAPQPQTKEDLMRAVQTDLAKKRLNDLVKAMQTQCFKRCVLKPAGSLSSSEQACVGGCVDKYWETFDIVAREWNGHVSAMGQGLGR